MTFMLILLLITPRGEDETYVLDYNMSKGDCLDALADYNTTNNRMIEFICVPEPQA